MRPRPSTQSRTQATHALSHHDESVSDPKSAHFLSAVSPRSSNPVYNATGLLSPLSDRPLSHKSQPAQGSQPSICRLSSPARRDTAFASAHANSSARLE